MNLPETPFQSVQTDSDKPETWNDNSANVAGDEVIVTTSAISKKSNILLIVLAVVLALILFNGKRK